MNNYNPIKKQKAEINKLRIPHDALARALYWMQITPNSIGIAHKSRRRLLCASFASGFGFCLRESAAQQ